MKKRDIRFYTMMIATLCCVVCAGLTYAEPSPIAVGCTTGVTLCWIMDVISFFTTKGDRNE